MRGLLIKMVGAGDSEEEGDCRKGEKVIVNLIETAFASTQQILQLLKWKPSFSATHF